MEMDKHGTAFGSIGPSIFGCGNVVLSFIFFYFLRRLVENFLTPEVIRLQGRVTRWKWVNTWVSLVHSFMTGAGAVLCFYVSPVLKSDVVNAYSVLAHGLTAFSVGYFIFDFGDMLLHHRKRSSYEVMLHHTFVLLIFGESVWRQLYLGLIMMALVIEVNSVFLHWRQILLICDIPKSSGYYKSISFLNLCTFLLFRLATLSWLVNWLAENPHKIPNRMYTLGCVVTGMIMIISIVLLLRILKADFRSYNNLPGDHEKIH